MRATAVGIRKIVHAIFATLIVPAECREVTSNLQRRERAFLRGNPEKSASDQDKALRRTMTARPPLAAAGVEINDRIVAVYCFSAPGFARRNLPHKGL